MKVLSLTLLLLSQAVIAGVNLDRSIIYFNPDTYYRQDVNVSNPDEEPLYLQTEVYQVQYPGTDQETRQLMTDPREMKFLVTPRRALVKQDNKKRIRLINMEKGLKEEKVYRVRFRPVVGPIKTDKPAIKLLVAYEVLVFVRPEKPVFNVEAKIAGNRLELINTGNSNIVIRHLMQCQKKDDCKELQAYKRLYVGQSLSTLLTHFGVIQYGMFDGKDEVQKTIPYNSKPSTSATKNISKI